VVHDNNLGLETGDSERGVGLGVRGHISTSKIPDGNVLHVETNVVTGKSLGKRLVVHFDRLNFSNNSGWGEAGMHTRLDYTTLNTADGHSSDTTNLVHILKRNTKGLLGRTLGGDDAIKGLEQAGSIVPRHVGGFFNHVISLPSRDRNERNLHGLVSDLLEVGEDLTLDFRESGFAVIDGLVVHLVASNNHLLDTKSVGKKGVLTSLAILGDTSLETALRRVDDQHSDVGLGGSGDHVLDEITVSGGVDNSELEIGRFELPKGNIDGDTTLTLGLEVIQNPGILEGSLTNFGGFLLELFDGTLVDTSALVDQVTGGGGFSCSAKRREKLGAD
jgi:hypothetical protein